MFSPLEQFDVITILNISIFGIDFSILNVILPLLLTNIFLFFFFFLFNLNMKLIPNNFQYFFENIYNIIFNIIKAQTGYKGLKYLPIILTLFLFILITNLISLTPFGIALTSHIIMIIFLSFTLCSSIFLIGLITHQLQFLKLFIPECPFILLFLLIPIEIFSYVIRAFSLAIRLSANIMAGHTLVFIISSFILNITNMKF